LLEASLQDKCAEMLQLDGPCPSFADFVASTGWLVGTDTSIARATVQRCGTDDPARQVDMYIWDGDVPNPVPYSAQYYQYAVLFDTVTGEPVMMSLTQIPMAVGGVREVLCCEGTPLNELAWGEYVTADCRTTRIPYSPSDF
jgi:hypothetical protein